MEQKKMIILVIVTLLLFVLIPIGLYYFLNSSKTGGKPGGKHIPTPNMMARLTPLYPGCGYVYQSKIQRDKSCKSGTGLLKFIPNQDSDFSMKPNQILYQGCGYVYASADERNKSCGVSSEWLKFVPTPL
jgi:hypothetical protein